jgi:hypothetical protein
MWIKKFSIKMEQSRKKNQNAFHTLFLTICFCRIHFYFIFLLFLLSRSKRLVISYTAFVYDYHYIHSVRRNFYYFFVYFMHHFIFLTRNRFKILRVFDAYLSFYLNLSINLGYIKMLSHAQSLVCTDSPIFFSFFLYYYQHHIKMNAFI